MKAQLIDHKYIGYNCFWLSSFGRVGTSFRCSQIDLESVDPDQTERSFDIAFKEISDDLNIKWHLFTNVTTEEENDHARAMYISEIGKSSSFVIVHFELKAKSFVSNLTKSIGGSGTDFFDKEAEKLNSMIPLDDLIRLGLNPIPLSFEEITSLFPEMGLPIIDRPIGIDLGTEIVGVLKLVELGKYRMSYETLGTIKDQLPIPCEIVVHHKKESQTTTSNKLETITKRESRPTNSTEAQKSVESEEAQRAVELGGEAHHAFEFHVLIRRTSEPELKKALGQAKRILSNIGVFTLESIGAKPSYISTLPGTPFHFAGPFEACVEEHRKLPCYLPVFTNGFSDATPAKPGSLAFHRLDFSLNYLSIFNPSYDNYCTVIVGRGGTGKSNFLNRKILSSHHNSKNRQIIVDVLGSHTRLVSRLGGEIHKISPTTPSGVNIFKYLETNNDEDTIDVVATFVSELMLDDDEKKLSEESKFEVYSKLQDWIDSKPDEYILDSFISSLPKDFPRLNLLKRFSNRGQFRHLFANQKNVVKQDRPRITLYNFENLNLASNTAAARAIMAAILADFNFQIFSKDRDEELEFISDETPFFIECCFASFKLLNLNVRKLVASLILTVQVSDHLVVDGDESLISNSGLYILFSHDGKPEVFGPRFKLSESEMTKMLNIRGVKGQYSQFLIKDKLGSRIGHLFLAATEYWEGTTEGVDVGTINALKENLPNLPEEVIFQILAASRNQKIQRKSIAEVST